MKNGKKAWKGLKRIARKVGKGTKKAYKVAKPIAKTTYKGSVGAARQIARDIKGVRQAGSIHTPRKTILKGKKKVRKKGEAYVSGWKQVPKKVGKKWKVEKVPIIKYRGLKKKRKRKVISSKKYRSFDEIAFGI